MVDKRWLKKRKYWDDLIDRDRIARRLARLPQERLESKQINAWGRHNDLTEIVERRQLFGCNLLLAIASVVISAIVITVHCTIAADNYVTPLLLAIYGVVAVLITIAVFGIAYLYYRKKEFELFELEALLDQLTDDDEVLKKIWAKSDRVELGDSDKISLEGFVLDDSVPTAPPTAETTKPGTVAEVLDEIEAFRKSLITPSS